MCKSNYSFLRYSIRPVPALPFGAYEWPDDRLSRARGGNYIPCFRRCVESALTRSSFVLPGYSCVRSIKYMRKTGGNGTILPAGDNDILNPVDTVASVESESEPIMEMLLISPPLGQAGCVLTFLTSVDARRWKFPPEPRSSSCQWKNIARSSFQWDSGHCPHA